MMVAWSIALLLPVLAAAQKGSSVDGSRGAYRAEPVMKGGNKDEGGCYTSAGYSFCKHTGRCHSFDEPCELAYKVPPADDKRTAMASELTSSSATLAKDTDNVARQVIKAYDTNTKLAAETKAKTDEAKAKTEKEIKEMTDAVSYKALEATRALSDAEGKILKISGDAAVKTAEIKADTEATSNDIKSSTAKAGEDAKKALKDQASVIATKKDTELKKAKDAEDTTASISLKGASDAADVIKAGVNGLDSAAAAVVAKAGEDVKAAKEKAIADAMGAAKDSLDKQQADKNRGEKEAALNKAKVVSMREMLSTARKDLLATINGAYDTLLGSPLLLKGDVKTLPVIKEPEPIMLDGARLNPMPPMIMDGMGGIPEIYKEEKAKTSKAQKIEMEKYEVPKKAMIMDGGRDGMSFPSDFSYKKEDAKKALKGDQEKYKVMDGGKNALNHNSLNLMMKNARAAESAADSKATLEDEPSEELVSQH